MKTEFKGDENWELSDYLKNDKKSDFFCGWFEDKKGKLLEAGCGTGNYLVVFSKKGFNVTGIEIDPKRVKLAKQNTKKHKVHATISQGDVRKLKFKDESFDIIFSHGVVEHFPETQQALGEIFRVLKKRGHAMISVPARFSFFLVFKYLQIFSDKIFKTEFWNCGYEKSFSTWRFRRMLQKANFKIIEQKITQASPGKRFPLIGLIERIMDKPFYWFGIGGRFMLFFVKKE